MYQTLQHLALYAFDDVFNFSYLPLRLLIYAKAVISTADFALGLYYVVKRLINIETAPKGIARSRDCLPSSAPAATGPHDVTASESSAPPATARPLSVAAPLLSLSWLLLPVACHMGFSWIGFNPTDDGWLQAVARRLLDGEVPHRDFIFVRPALSALLQVPLVALGGDHVIWLSRLWGWLTLAAVSWIWSGRAVAPATAWPVRAGLYAGALLLGAHTFPVMAWHSLDGMLGASLAVLLAARRTAWSLRAAFCVAGLAALCRQNFALFAPLLLLATGGKVRDWFVAGLCAALPALLYLGGMAAAGGLPDFFHQTWATSGAFRTVGVLRFVRDPWLWGGVLLGGVLAGGLLWRKTAESPPGRWLAAGVFLAAGGYAAWTLWHEPAYFHAASLGLLGLGIGLSVVAAVRGIGPDDRLSLVAGLGLAWITAISIGYNSPALMAGVLLLLLWRLLHLLRPSDRSAPAGLHSALLLVLLPVAAAFTHARQTFPYRDQRAERLRWDIGPVLAGGVGLRTNQLTFLTLADLQILTARLAGERHRFAILTDCPAFWIRSPQRNPLPCEWPQETELGYSPALFGRMFASLRQLPPDARIIVQKYLISDYAWRLTAVAPEQDCYFAQNWVHRNCRKVEETRFFAVYLPPGAGPR